MKKIFLKSYAKVNLYLDVLAKRKDGYHNVKTIMQNVNLFDEIHIKITPSKTKNISVVFDGMDLPQKENTVYKSAFLFVSKLYENFDIKINVKKNIPHGSGLGGASSNAAATLVGLNHLIEKPFSPIQLHNIAKKIGSDVPFFLKGGTCVCTKRGDVVKKILFSVNFPIAVIYPNISISTRWAYQNLDLNSRFKKKNIRIILDGIKNNKISEICSGLFNFFESVIIKHYPFIGQIKQDMLISGAEGALLTGSGSCVFGIFKDKGLIKIPNRSNIKTFILDCVPIGFDIF